ncbi:hypothetical protein FB382_000782 [Nocardioides ginsengisegetis]|uniref:Histidine kinase n=1 Tax=Nocardioides ginsengisegetis TaxID=661491 RepID=A0A7W3IXI9_9ACTN|nr:hypothetical protein [Nocardioides ginsengisegetis]MBA8802491.1 hypothetical protein [Nocardioides ginsengisegetis]
MTTMTDSPRTTSRMTTEPGVRFGIANGLLVATLITASVARLEVPAMELVAVAAAGLVAVGLSHAMTAGLGVIAWAWFTGFVENDFGQLTLAPDDLRRLVVFVVATLAVAVVARHIHHSIKENARV